MAPKNEIVHAESNEEKIIGAGQDGDLSSLGYEPILHRRGSILTLPFQSLAIAITPNPPLPTTTYTHDRGSFASLPLPLLTATSTGPDGENVVTENGPRIKYSFPDRDALVSFSRAAFETQQSVHLVGRGELTCISED
ncbi:uncharacterized protein BJX67DRAFT_383043 [Aspergillus lucknowensis]|uniref:Uncharacterized protein n=1 Tax=Aspergillus lucknowensis TaxID=176173 RepID=A0ABR4LPL0_9EURO